MNALESLIAAVVASLPFLTKRTISAHGTISVSFSAKITSTSPCKEKLIPLFSCSITASLTSLILYPIVIGPNAHTKSMNLFPSTSYK